MQSKLLNMNSLDAQPESAEAFIVSQRHEGWESVAESNDDGGFTGDNMERPALKRLLADIKAGKIDGVIVQQSRPPQSFAYGLCTHHRDL